MIRMKSIEHQTLPLSKEISLDAQVGESGAIAHLPEHEPTPNSYEISKKVNSNLRENTKRVIPDEDSLEYERYMMLRISRSYE